ncbi:hypothetical protein [Peribacillus frigoritolerans]|uniref:Uncharacterized protein n=1 Tax=Peribacillus castrilensis TaxID=2897690 RepID=A0AAW9NJG3_9BACI|nr:hypothetical protein [Peribacillus castrilensis]
MTGINNNSLVYGVLDLIKREMSKQSPITHLSDAESDPLGDTPSVILEREHPDDEDQLTGATLVYPSGYMTHINLILGLTDEEIEIALAKNNYPDIEVDPNPGDGLTEWESLTFEEQQALLDPPDEEEDYVDDEDDLPDEDLSDEMTEEELALSETLGVDADDALFPDNILEPVLPEDIKDQSHPDFEFYAKWRLSRVEIETSNQAGVLTQHFMIHLVYNYKSMLQATMVEQLLAPIETDI